MDIVLVGLPGSGKSVVGKRLAHRHGATFIDLDERIEREDGRSIPVIFEEDGEAAFRALERRAVADLGAGRSRHRRRRDRRDRRRGHRGPAQSMGLLPRPPGVWLDGRPEVLAQRLRRSPHVRPLVVGRDPIGIDARPGGPARAVLRRGRVRVSGVPRSTTSWRRSTRSATRAPTRRGARRDPARCRDADRSDPPGRRVAAEGVDDALRGSRLSGRSSSPNRAPGSGRRRPLGRLAARGLDGSRS